MGLRVFGRCYEERNRIINMEILSIRFGIAQHKSCIITLNFHFTCD